MGIVQALAAIQFGKAVRIGEVIWMQIQQNDRSADGLFREGSLQEILSHNTGRFVLCEFLIGTQTVYRKEGILLFVGSDYLVLFDVVKDSYVACDFHSLRFATFYPKGTTPSPTDTVPGALGFSFA